MASSASSPVLPADASRKSSSVSRRQRRTLSRYSSFLVPKRRNRYGCETPALRAITSVEVPCRPCAANSSKAATRISSRRWSAVFRSAATILVVSYHSLTTTSRTGVRHAHESVTACKREALTRLEQPVPALAERRMREPARRCQTPSRNRVFRERDQAGAVADVLEQRERAAGGDDRAGPVEPGALAARRNGQRVPPRLQCCDPELLRPRRPSRGPGVLGP